MSHPEVEDAWAYHQVVAVSKEPDDTPAVFKAAVEQVQRAILRPEMVTDAMPAPRRIAPFSYAMTGDVVVGADELGTGRFILLHDPAGNDAWQGTFRCVTFARADIDTDMAADPLLPAVGWSWLMEALNAPDAGHIAASGSVTVVRSEPFGAMAEDGGDAQLEVRASWTPTSGIQAHVEAWSGLLCTLAGLPPLEPGVIALPSRRGQR